MAEKGYLLNGEPNIENVISGKLCYLKMVKGGNDSQYLKLSEQFAKLTSGTTRILKERSWEYLQTESIGDFEKRLGVSIQYANSNKGKSYAFFELDGQNILASVSQNISIKQIPKDVQISLCLQTDFKIRFGGEFHISPNQWDHANVNTVFGRMKMDCPLPEDLGQRFFYLIHRPLKSDAQKRIIVKEKNAEILKKEVVEIAQQRSLKLELKETFNIIESSMSQPKDILTQLIESNFNLSILP